MPPSRPTKNDASIPRSSSSSSSSSKDRNRDSNSWRVSLSRANLRDGSKKKKKHPSEEGEDNNDDDHRNDPRHKNRNNKQQQQQFEESSSQLSFRSGQLEQLNHLHKATTFKTIRGMVSTTKKKKTTATKIVVGASVVVSMTKPSSSSAAIATTSTPVSTQRAGLAIAPSSSTTNSSTSCSSSSSPTKDTSRFPTKTKKRHRSTLERLDDDSSDDSKPEKDEVAPVNPLRIPNNKRRRRENEELPNNKRKTLVPAGGSSNDRDDNCSSSGVEILLSPSSDTKEVGIPNQTRKRGAATTISAAGTTTTTKKKSHETNDPDRTSTARQRQTKPECGSTKLRSRPTIFLAGSSDISESDNSDDDDDDEKIGENRKTARVPNDRIRQHNKSIATVASSSKTRERRTKLKVKNSNDDSSLRGTSLRQKDTAPEKDNTIPKKKKDTNRSTAENDYTITRKKKKLATAEKEHSDKDDDDDLEMPYFQNLGVPGDSQRPPDFSTQREPLRPGDVIVYNHPMHVAGTAQARRVAQVWKTTPGAEIPLELSNGEVIPADTQIRRCKEYDKRQNRLLEHRGGVYRPIESFRMNEAVFAEAKDAWKAQVKRIQAFMTTTKEELEKVPQQCDEEDTGSCSEESDDGDSVIKQKRVKRMTLNSSTAVEEGLPKSAKKEQSTLKSGVSSNSSIAVSLDSGSRDGHKSNDSGQKENDCGPASPSSKVLPPGSSASSAILLDMAPTVKVSTIQCVRKSRTAPSSAARKNDFLSSSDDDDDDDIGGDQLKLKLPAKAPSLKSLMASQIGGGVLSPLVKESDQMRPASSKNILGRSKLSLGKPRISPSKKASGWVTVQHSVSKAEATPAVAAIGKLQVSRKRLEADQKRKDAASDSSCSSWGGGNKDRRGPYCQDVCDSSDGEDEIVSVRSKRLEALQPKKASLFTASSPEPAAKRAASKSTAKRSVPKTAETTYKKSKPSTVNEKSKTVHSNSRSSMDRKSFAPFQSAQRPVQQETYRDIGCEDSSDDDENKGSRPYLQATLALRSHSDRLEANDLEIESSFPSSQSSVEKTKTAKTPVLGRRTGAWNSIRRSKSTTKNHNNHSNGMRLTIRKVTHSATRFDDL